MDGEESSPAEAAFAEDPALSLTRPYSALTLLPTEVLVLSRAAATDLALQWRQEVELLARAAAEEAEDVLRAKHENARRGVFRIVRRWAFLAQSAGACWRRWLWLLIHLRGWVVVALCPPQASLMPPPTPPPPRTHTHTTTRVCAIPSQRPNHHHTPRV